MFPKLRQHWQHFKSLPPGKRFVETHRESRRGQRSVAGRVLRIVAGLVVTIVGLVMLPAPGPGMLVVLLGLVLLAHESLIVARGLDAAERVLRPILASLHAWWQRRSAGQRVLLATPVVLLALMAAFAAYEVFVA